MSALELPTIPSAEPQADFSLAENAAPPPPAPERRYVTYETAGAIPVPTPAGTQVADEDAVMAMAEGEPSDALSAAEADIPVQQAMIQRGYGTEQYAAPSPFPASPADPATARIYSANAAPAVSPPPRVASTAPRRGGGLLALFTNARANNAREALIPPSPVAQQSSTAEVWSAPGNSAPLPKPAVRPVISVGNAGATAAGLPGFDRNRAPGQNPAGAPPEGDQKKPPLQLASAAGLARLAPHGLHIQNSNVDVSCLKPELVRVLKKVERHYGRPVVVTSGYRDPNRNKKARGVENSLHIYCAAADIQIEGVTKSELASYLRSMPGRGGVGTYCYTDSVHIDIGPERDWNWRCRRRK